MQAEVPLRAGDATVFHSSQILIEVFLLEKINNSHSDTRTCLLQLMAFSYSSIFFCEFTDHEVWRRQLQ